MWTRKLTFNSIAFDDGPGPYTPILLKILKESNIKATFFVIGENARSFPAILKQTFDQGHVIASHTVTHPDFVSCQLFDDDQCL